MVRKGNSADHSGKPRRRARDAPVPNAGCDIAEPLVAAATTHMWEEMFTQTHNAARGLVADERRSCSYQILKPHG